MLNILYFASIREALGKESEVIELPASANVAGLVEVLRSRGDRYAEVLAANRRWRVAVNQEMVGLDAVVKDGDEIAVFPPVTGG